MVWSQWDLDVQDLAGVGLRLHPRQVDLLMTPGAAVLSIEAMPDPFHHYQGCCFAPLIDGETGKPLLVPLVGTVEDITDTNTYMLDELADGWDRFPSIVMQCQEAYADEYVVRRLWDVHPLQSHQRFAYSDGRMEAYSLPQITCIDRAADIFLNGISLEAVSEFGIDPEDLLTETKELHPDLTHDALERALESRVEEIAEVLIQDAMGHMASMTQGDIDLALDLPGQFDAVWRQLRSQSARGWQLAGLALPDLGYREQLEEGFFSPWS